VKVLVTGAAGFIGFHLSAALLARGDTVVGLDSVNAYYDPLLKEHRLQRLAGRNFEIIRGDLRDESAVAEAFDSGPDRIVHLAAQAGVRHSLTHPHDYVNSNVTGTLNVLEACRRHGTEHLVYASSSSVYGANTKLPFSVHDNVDHPMNMYAASKKSTELMAHVYSNLFDIPTTGLRFFSVYGPWGRPDMALFMFTRSILAGEPIDVYNDGNMQRDFTYIDDIVEGVVRVLDRPPAPNPEWTGDAPDAATSFAPYRLYNIGNNQPVQLLRFIGAIEAALGRTAELNLMPLQPGDVPATCADIDDLVRDTGFAPSTTVEEGIARFVEWYVEYYDVKL
jgi:UDP-glucuronate 4-epimerase